MGHLSSSKFSTDYEDKDEEEVNQPTLSPKREEVPTEDNGKPTDEEEEAP